MNSLSVPVQVYRLKMYRDNLGRADPESLQGHVKSKSEGEGFLIFSVVPKVKQKAK